MSTPLLKKYISYQKSLENTYNTECVVLIMNGSFYNIYEFNCPQLKVGCATKVSNILNILLTKNNKHKSIAVSKIPNKGLGKTINDRLMRASRF